MSKPKIYALHGSTHLLESGEKLYVNPSDLIYAYGLTNDDEYVFWDARDHVENGNYIHLKATPDILEKIFPESVGEHRLV